MTSDRTLSRSTVLVLMLVSIHHLTWNIKKDIGLPVRQWSGFGILTHQTIQIAEPIVSPLQASIEQLEGLPPALVINGENDVLCDEGEAYARKLLEAGVRVTAVRYHGTIHDFVMLNAITDDPAPRGAIEQASPMLKKILSTWTELIAIGVTTATID